MPLCVQPKILTLVFLQIYTEVNDRYLTEGPLYLSQRRTSLLCKKLLHFTSVMHLFVLDTRITCLCKCLLCTFIVHSPQIVSKKNGGRPYQGKKWK